MRAIKKVGIGVGIAVAAFFGLLIAVGLTYHPAQSQITSSPAPVQNTNSPINPQTQAIVSQSGVAYNVTSVRPTEADRQSIQLDVYLQIKNTGSSPVDVTSTLDYGTFDYRLVDAQSRKFDASYAQIDNAKLNPGISTFALFWFDIPKSPSPMDYQLLISQPGVSSIIIDLGQY